MKPHARIEGPGHDGPPGPTQLRIELPGVAPVDIELSLEDEILTVRGPARPIDRSGFEEVRLAEINTDVGYERSFRIAAEVDADAIEARFANGVLEVLLPRRQPKARQISIG